MAAVKTSTDPKRRADFLDSMEEEIRRVSEHLERREKRLGLKSRRNTAVGEIMNGYSFSEGSGAEAGARRRRVNPYPRQLKTSGERERSWTSSPDTRSPSPGQRSAPPDSSPPQQLPPPSSPRESPAATSSRSPERSEEPARDPTREVTISNRARRAASSSPLRSPPPVAPKPRSRGSPSPLSLPHRARAGSAPPAHRPPSKEQRQTDREREERDRKREEKVSETVEMEESRELLESDPTPVPNELSEQPLSLSLTPEPSEPLLLVIEQTRREGTPESSCSTLSPCPSSPSSSLEVGEARGKEAASPGIIEISGSFSFAKKRSLERSEDGEGGLERVEEEVESALLEAMMEGKEGEGKKPSESEREITVHKEEPTDDITSNQPTDDMTSNRPNDDIISDHLTSHGCSEEVAVDPQGLEVKTLPLLSGGGGRRVGQQQQQQQQRRGQELLVRELELQLREKEEELGRQRRVGEREAREREEEVVRLTKEGQKLEREKWELLRRARDGAERVLHLRTALDLKETQLRSFQGELSRTRDEMMSVKSANTSLRALLSELRAPKASRDVGVQVALEAGTLKRNNSMELAVQDLSRPTSGALERGIDFRASTTNLDRGVNHRVSNCSAVSEGWSQTQGWERGSDHWEREQSVTSVSSAAFDPGSREETPSYSPHSGRKMKKKRGPLFGKLRKSTGKRGSTPTIIDGVDLTQSSSLVQGAGRPPISFPYHTRVGRETQEHWRALEEAQHVPFQLWPGRTIIAWVTTGLGMGQYVSSAREHITNGNAMLALSDSDMDKKLGVANPLHRRKLRLAIEEKRRPDRVRYPLAGKIDTDWLAEVWVSDIGLPQISDIITNHLLDGRVLESLTKDDLKKYLKLKKMEQLSFLSGVELLRMHNYNREAIQDIRASQQSRSSPQNPLYWTNRDAGDWIRDIQLGDYATNLLQSGVHGALLFLERGDRGKFSSDQLAQILQLPGGGKNVAKRHLSQQLTRLFREDGADLFMSQHNSVTSFQSNPRGGSPLSPPFSGSLYRAGSSPSLNQAGYLSDRLSMEDRIRHSLRESALRSVTSTISPRTPSPSSSPSSQFSHPPSPHLPSAPSPLTQSRATGTTV